MRRQPAQAGAAGSSKEEMGRFKKNKLKGSFGDAGSFLPLVRQVDKSEEEAWTGRRWQEAVFLPLAQAQTLGGLNALRRRYRCNSNSFLGSFEKLLYMDIARTLFVCLYAYCLCGFEGNIGYSTYRRIDRNQSELHHASYVYAF